MRPEGGTESFVGVQTHTIPCRVYSADSYKPNGVPSNCDSQGEGGPLRSAHPL